MGNDKRRTRGFIVAASGAVWLLVGLIILRSLEIATFGGIAIVIGLYYASSTPSAERRRFRWKRS